MVDTCVSAPYLQSSFPSRFQTLRAFPMFQRTAIQLFSDQFKILPRYSKVSTPYMQSMSSSSERLNVVLSHWLSVATSFLRHRICVFWSHQFVRWCLSIRPAGICIPHRSQQSSGYLPSCTTAIQAKKFLNMKCSLIRPTLCATAVHPGTGHLTVFSTQGKETTWVIVPPPLSPPLYAVESFRVD